MEINLININIDSIFSMSVLILLYFDVVLKNLKRK